MFHSLEYDSLPKGRAQMSIRNFVEALRDTRVVSRSAAVRVIGRWERSHGTSSKHSCPKRTERPIPAAARTLARRTHTNALSEALSLRPSE
ncbi:unnamed protein product, partial [Iphiclides podalirius]